MDIIATEHPEILLIGTDWWGDSRGGFSEVYNRKTWTALGVSQDFCQDNQAYSRQRGTIRGLHMQRPPSAQAKLVRVVQGAILDVAVDVRAGSPHFGRWVARELSAQNRLQMLIPIGFAHGYCTLHPDTEVLYKVDSHYDPASECGILWNDPALGIPWPDLADPMTVLPRDASLPKLSEMEPVFSFVQAPGNDD